MTRKYLYTNVRTANSYRSQYYRRLTLMRAMLILYTSRRRAILWFRWKGVSNTEISPLPIHSQQSVRMCTAKANTSKRPATAWFGCVIAASAEPNWSDLWPIFGRSFGTLEQKMFWACQGSAWLPEIRPRPWNVYSFIVNKCCNARAANLPNVGQGRTDIKIYLHYRRLP